MSQGGGADGKKKAGCAAFLRGQCNFGWACIFSHDADAVVVCKHYPRCIRGASCPCPNYSDCTQPQCPNAHESDDAPEATATSTDDSGDGYDRQGRKICANFKLGTCSFGEMCKHSHDDDDIVCKHHPNCSRGDNCPFLHTKINPPRQHERVCFTYLRGRRCENSACTFLHDTVDSNGKPLVIPSCSHFTNCNNLKCRFLHAMPDPRHVPHPPICHPPSLPVMDGTGWTQHKVGPPEMPDLPEPPKPVWTLATARPVMERLTAVRRMVDALKRQEVARVSAVRTGLQALSDKLESTSETVGDIASTLLQSQEVIDVCTSTLAAVANHKHRLRQRKLRGRRRGPIVRQRACDSDMSVSISDDTPASKRPRFT